MGNILNETPSYYNEWVNTFNKRKEDILNLISNKNEISITIHNSQMKDAIEYKKDKTYIPKNLIQIRNNKIITKYISEEFIKFILNNLNENIETLNAPGEFLQYPEVLGLYPKLNTFNVTNYYELTLNEVINIKNKTNLNQVNTINFNSLTNTDEINALYYDGKIQELKFIDKNLSITNPNKRYKIICHNFIIPNLYQNLDKVEQYIKEQNINPKDLEYFNVISTTINEDYICYYKKEDELEYYGDLTQIKSIIDFMNRINLHPKNILLKLENKDYDYKLLKGINYPILINYDQSHTATVQEFIAMRETINYFVNIIKGSNLSKLEQVLYAYEICKSFKYNEGKHPEDSREIHKIIETGNIVCVGYSLLYKQILKELNIKCEDYSVNAGNTYNNNSNNEYNHRRVLIRIDDDKYNIHMIAACDPTWDSYSVDYSYNKFNAENAAILGNAYNLLSYIHFLIPKEEYEYVFDDKDTPAIFKYSPDFISRNFDSLPLYSTANKTFDDALYYYQRLFNKDEGNLIKQYVNAKRPPYEVFKEALKNVKYAQGYGAYTERIINSFEYENENSKKIR